MRSQRPARTRAKTTLQVERTMQQPCTLEQLSSIWKPQPHSGFLLSALQGTYAIFSTRLCAARYFGCMYSISFHFIYLLYNNRWLMSVCGDIIDMEVTVGNCWRMCTNFWLLKVICVWSQGPRWTWTNKAKVHRESRSKFVRKWSYMHRMLVMYFLMLEHDWDRSNVGSAFHRCSYHSIKVEVASGWGADKILSETDCAGGSCGWGWEWYVMVENEVVGGL